MDILDEDLLNYSEQHSSPESELLAKLNRTTHVEVLNPIMLSGHLQGRVLSLISKLISPKLILEIGAYTGYSALCMLEGLRPDGQLITIDNNQELEVIHKKYLLSHSKSNQIRVEYGDALTLIPALPNEIDLIFIDADKPNYINYFNAVLDKLKVGGLILADNVLWKGKVIDDSDQGKSTVALRNFNREIQENKRVENVLLPIRDGIMAIRKIA